ncbi:RNA polymerase sigma factor [Hyphococcus flavus]|uniref:RNA polymerase sigma factor n=1 Tax=Hyphococcus flavus TaxID=1866326 RepID=A0AAE9ZDW4_9PROT|nr:RNA polymerase sigma factor [Hyphococcus flavus]WDI31835.1 RNA polymerase sigma factor [Hyphococcus flavus]
MVTAGQAPKWAGFHMAERDNRDGKEQDLAAPHSSEKAGELEAVFLATRPELKSFIQRRIDDPQMADDLVQDVYIRAARSENSNEIRQPRALLFSIALNLLRDRFRKKKVRRETQIDRVEWVSGEPAETPEEALIRGIESERVRAVFDEATERQQAIFVMHWQQGLVYAEISKRLNISVRTVERDMSRIVKRMLLELES